jgi:hypothetical protein
MFTEEDDDKDIPRILQMVVNKFTSKMAVY